MIPNKLRETRKVRAMKMSKNIERLYREAKCRECAVVITRMDFAKILGRFTKVKIQYESSAIRKDKVSSPNSKSRLKSNENGMVYPSRKTNSEPPAKEFISRKPKSNEKCYSSPNILRENNSLKKSKNHSINNNKAGNQIKRYGIIFEQPIINNKDSRNKITLSELLPHIDSDILPSEDWLVDYFPKTDEPKDDKVYDRIAAELEDLMYNEKTKTIKIEEQQPIDNKIDEFPTIMDILNDNVNVNNKPENQISTELKSNLESSDVEAILLGKTTHDTCSTSEPMPMEVDAVAENNLMANVDQLNPIPESVPLTDGSDLKDGLIDNIDNPHSPSILDETLQKGIEEHLPPAAAVLSTLDSVTEQKEIEISMDETKCSKDDSSVTNASTDEFESTIDKKIINFSLPLIGVEEVIFQKTTDGKCFKSVICPKNLKYKITLEGKPVEFLGAPQYVSSLEDLKVLLQIVNETELKNLYVKH